MSKSKCEIQESFYKPIDVFDMKILNVTFAESDQDKRAWSGTAYKTLQALRQTGYQVDFLPVKNVPFPMLLRLQWLTYRIMRKCGLTKHIFLPTFTNSFRNAVKSWLETFDFASYDYLFVTASSVISNALVMLKKEKHFDAKVVTLVDAPFCAIENYYDTSTNLYPANSDEANQIGRDFFCSADRVITASQWAKDNAVARYGTNPNKIHVIEFGANIDTPILGTRTISFKDKTHYNILLSGVDWVRKGGEVAVECCEQLVRMRGGKFTLHIVGMPVPEQYKALPFIKEYGFLNKNIPEQYAKYLAILEQMDIFLFPSRAECAGIVHCEASGYGMPIFCYETGGAANYVVNGKNGERLPLSATGKDFAAAIMNAIETNKLDDYSRGAQEMYNTRLNWNTWTQRVKNEILTN